jgi:hypothetical protein
MQLPSAFWQNAGLDVSDPTLNAAQMLDFKAALENS